MNAIQSIASAEFFKPTTAGENILIPGYGVYYYDPGSMMSRDGAFVLYVDNNTNPATSGRWLNTAIYPAANIQGGFKNLLINGRFALWQRGTTFTATGYTADRWLLTLGTGAAVNVTALPITAWPYSPTPVPSYSYSLQRTIAGTTATTLAQRIENVRLAAGRRVTISFYAGADITVNLTVKIRQFFNGSPDNVVTLGTVTVPGGSSGKNILSGVLATTPAVIGADNTTYTELIIEYPNTEPNTTIRFGDIQLERAGFDTEIEVLPIAQELQRAQRYYATGIVNYFEGSVMNGHWYGSTAEFPEIMRAVPVVLNEIILFKQRFPANPLTTRLLTTSARMGRLKTGRTGSARRGRYAIQYDIEAEL